MAETPTLPQLQHPIFPATSDTPTSTGTPTTKPRWTSGAMLALIITIVANLVIIVVIANRGDSTPAITARPRVLALPEVRPGPPAPAGPPALAPILATTFGEGRFVVGTDIAPGTYQTSGKSGRSDCYWERLTDTNGTTASIIANDLAPGPATVTIDKTDAAFQTRWCRPWTKVSTVPD